MDGTVSEDFQGAVSRTRGARGGGEKRGKKTAKDRDQEGPTTSNKSWGRRKKRVTCTAQPTALKWISLSLLSHHVRAVGASLRGGGCCASASHRSACAPGSSSAVPGSRGKHCWSATVGAKSCGLEPRLQNLPRASWALRLDPTARPRPSLILLPPSHAWWPAEPTRFQTPAPSPQT